MKDHGLMDSVFRKLIDNGHGQAMPTIQSKLLYYASYSALSYHRNRKIQ